MKHTTYSLPPKKEEASEGAVSKVPSEGSGFDDPFFSSVTTVRM